MGFGQSYIKTGKFAPKGIRKLAQAGYSNQEDFLKENNLNQQSSGKDFQSAIGAKQAWQTPPRNIDRNFSFTNLPEVGNNAVTKQLRDQATGLYNDSVAGRQLGSQVQGQGEGALVDLLGTTLNEYGERTGIEGDARNRFLSQSESAIDPRFNANQQAFLDQGLNTRMADVNRFYGSPQGPGREQLAKNLAYNVADLDQLGVGGTSAGNVIGTTLSNFNRDYASATQQANELSRGESVGERNRIAGAYDTAAGRNLQDAASQGQMRGNLLGIGRGIGSDLTSSGAQRQQIATELAKLGITADTGATDLDMRQRQLEAELQQGEKAFQTDLTQQAIDNERIRRDRRRTAQLSGKLEDKYLNGGGKFLGLF